MTEPDKSRDSGYLDGQLLIAMPCMSDKRFARSVIYVCAHTADGAMGLIVNQRAPHISFSELLGQLSIEDDDDLRGRRLERHGCGRARRRAGGDGARVRAAQLRLFCGQFDLVDRCRGIAHRDRGHPEGHRQRQGAEPGHAGARLRRLAARAAGETRSRPTAGCTARAISTCCSTAISTRNTSVPCPRSASTRPTWSPRPVTPDVRGSDTRTRRRSGLQRRLERWCQPITGFADP